MDKKNFINEFSISKKNYKNYHTIGNLQSFSSPCIGYILEGEADFLYKGKHLYAKKGDLIYIATGSTYYSVWTGNPDISFFSLNFNFVSPFSFSDYEFQIVKNYPIDIIEKIWDFYEMDSFSSIGFLYILLSDLYEKMKKQKKNSHIDEIKPAISYIENNFKESFKISYLAKLCNLSESHFYNVFKRCTGTSPIAYKNNIIIQNALNLLSDTKMSIEEISNYLGFSSSNYFRKVFESITGFSPKKARYK